MKLAAVIADIRLRPRHFVLALAAGLGALAMAQPQATLETARFVVLGLLNVSPLVIPGIVLTAWIAASGVTGRIAGLFHGRTGGTVLAAATVGALVPVCGVTVLPLMAGLLAAGVPLAPVMAFWLASPVTGPAMLAATAATLGWDFALGKMLAAIGLGLLGGAVTALFARRSWTRAPLRDNRLVGALGQECRPCADADEGVEFRFWRTPARRRRFVGEALALTRLIVLVLVPAFAAEHLLNAWLQPDAMAAHVGRDAAFAIPLAVLVGAPAYVDGYAALPLTRALMDHGMSPGAAMAFLVSGGVVSIWGALAIFPILRLAPFLLYLTLAVAGAMAAGWIFGMAV